MVEKVTDASSRPPKREVADFVKDMLALYVQQVARSIRVVMHPQLFPLVRHFKLEWDRILRGLHSLPGERIKKNKSAMAVWRIKHLYTFLGDLQALLRHVQEQSREVPDDLVETRLRQVIYTPEGQAKLSYALPKLKPNVVSDTPIVLNLSPLVERALTGAAGRDFALEHIQQAITFLEACREQSPNPHSKRMLWNLGTLDTELLIGMLQSGGVASNGQ